MSEDSVALEDSDSKKNKKKLIIIFIIVAILALLFAVVLPIVLYFTLTQGNRNAGELSIRTSIVDSSSSEVVSWVQNDYKFLDLTKSGSSVSKPTNLKLIEGQEVHIEFSIKNVGDRTIAYSILPPDLNAEEDNILVAIFVNEQPATLTDGKIEGELNAQNTISIVITLSIADTSNSVNSSSNLEITLMGR